MSGLRAQFERDVLPKVGAAFFRGVNGDLLFQFVVDTANVIGPRPAVRSDQEKHPGAWAAFCEAEAVSALDRDASGEPGGSLPQEPADPKVDEQDYQPGDIACGEAQAADNDAAPKRKYTRRPKA